jgi:hypothetical protein
MVRKSGSRFSLGTERASVASAGTLEAITIEAADIGQARGAGRVSSAIVCPAIVRTAIVVGPRRAVIIPATIPRKDWHQIETDYQF